MTYEQARQILNEGLSREAKNEDGLNAVDQAFVTWLSDLQARVAKLETALREMTTNARNTIVSMPGEIPSISFDDLKEKKLKLQYAITNLLREFELSAPGVEVTRIELERANEPYPPMRDPRIRSYPARCDVAVTF